MAISKVKVGFLVPVGSSKDDENSSAIPVFEGLNIVGRGNLSVQDKRVSRKHISLKASIDGSDEVLVEGPNPIVVQSFSQRRKVNTMDKTFILPGDILELIPRHFCFLYEKLPIMERLPLTKDDTLNSKRKYQVLEDEAFAHTLQEKDLMAGSLRKICSVDAAGAPSEGKGAISNFNISSEKLSLIFRLLRVKGIPTWANASSVSISHVVKGNVLVAVLSNYMVDIEWLLSACPDLRKVPHVLIVHGESGASLERMKLQKPSHWILHHPPLPISYGTHHSKAMFLVYTHGVRIIIHTANLIHVDWNNKTQGLWMQDFPLKDQNTSVLGSSFEDELVDYLKALKWPEFAINFPSVCGVKFGPLFFKRFDYCDAAVRLIASVPGYHTGSSLKKWGHMKLREVLQSHIFEKKFVRSPVVYQFSSLGSLDEKWMSEFASSMSSGLSDEKTPLGLGSVQIIWPTVEDVRCSLEGYAAGSCIPSPQKNVEKEFLKKYWSRWKASHTGRCHAMPHIKSYTRYIGQNLAWFLLTSANLSKAAWGSLQKNNSQLMLRSYELGVLFLPHVVRLQHPRYSCTDDAGSSQVKYELPEAESYIAKLVTLCWQGSTCIDPSSASLRLPVPYELPPPRYEPEDIPWAWDRQYNKKDVHGQVWPCIW